MMAWFTDNRLSHIVLKSTGKPMRHINQMDKNELQPSVFYGMLRGAARGMHLLKRAGIDYWYIDNGYYEAKYINHNNIKEMDGTYRVVKNDTHCQFKGNSIKYSGEVKTILLIPPSAYSAMFNDTLPEDWINQSMKYLSNIYPELRFIIRNKNSEKPLESDINKSDAVFSFNSMSVIRAIECGKPVCDTHGLFRTMDFHVYKYKDIIDFYKDKQANVDKIKDLIV